jgi:molybdopterin biosynthesis enzyme
LGEITTVTPNLAESGKHNYGLIGPDKIPVVTLPGDPIGNYLSAELFIRPMILKMLAKSEIYRPSKKVKLSKDINSNLGKSSYVRAVINEDGQAVPLTHQDLISTLSNSTCLISLGEKIEKVAAGESVNLVMINQVQS